MPWAWALKGAVYGAAVALCSRVLLGVHANGSQLRLSCTLFSSSQVQTAEAPICAGLLDLSSCAPPCSICSVLQLLWPRAYMLLTITRWLTSTESSRCQDVSSHWVDSWHLDDSAEVGSCLGPMQHFVFACR